MPSSVPVTPAVCANTPTIAAIASAFTPSETPNARSRLPAPRDCTSVAMLPTHSRRRGRMRSARSGDADHNEESRARCSAGPARVDHSLATRRAASPARETVTATTSLVTSFSTTPTGASGMPRIAATIEATLRNANDLDPRVFDPAQCRVLQNAAQVLEDYALVRRVGRHAVDHDEHRQPASRDALHHVERNLVRIADRGRDEDAEVGGL